MNIDLRAVGQLWVRARTPIVILVISCGVFALIAAGVWYRTNRVSMLGALCRAGFPNLSRPAVVRADDLGCAILGPRRKVSGILLTDFEVSSLIDSDLPPAASAGSITSATWWTCNQSKGCGAEFNRQLASPIPGLNGMHLVHVTAYGWATETPGRYGHLNAYAREFFEEETLKVGPPPSGVVERLRNQLARSRRK